MEQSSARQGKGIYFFSFPAAGGQAWVIFDILKIQAGFFITPSCTSVL